MSDSPNEEADSTSNTILIEVEHRGVSAARQARLEPSTSCSEESTLGTVFYHAPRNSIYNEFSNTSQMDTATESPKVLYEMHTVPPKVARELPRKVTPSRIEFQLYRGQTRKKRHCQRKYCQGGKHKSKHSKTIFRRLVHNFTLMCATKTKHKSKSEATKKSSKMRGQESLQRESSPLPTIPMLRTSGTQTSPADTHIGIYHFEHGCSDFLRTTDCHPQIVSVVLADRANMCATRFWAEFFGSLNIGVAFFVTFLLQTYRFVLFSIVNMLIVGIMSMTSDYLIKPLLTGIFNGFLQPVFILFFNILSSVRDILEPIADNLNNFMKPLATVGQSIRLINVNYGNRKTVREV